MAKDTRSRIIRVAEEIFRKEPYQKVGIRQIAQAAGCSHTAIYQYFKKKEDILYAVAEKPLTHLYHTCLEISHSKQTDKERRSKSVKHMWILGLENEVFMNY